VEMACSPLSLTLPSSVVRHQPAIEATATESGDFCSRNVQGLRTQMTPFPKPTMKVKVIVLRKIEGCRSRHVFHESVLVNLGEKNDCYFMDPGE